MVHYGLPIVFALFVWWFSTGLIMYLDGLPRRTFKWSMLGATVLLVVSLWGLRASSGQTGIQAVYVAFACGLLAWGWQEISFYMGYVTGPRRAPCPEGCSGWRHFGHAVQTSLWHELAIIVAAIVVVALAWGRPNQIGVWTFMVLWWMHQSAKLNVFLGVRNLNEEFLPEHLAFLKSFLTKKPMNLLFPVSVTVSTVIAVHLVQVAAVPGAPVLQSAGYTFLATLMVLAILEHWLLVLPLPAAKLWGWSLTSRRAVAPFTVEVVAGFLGAGKTTYVRQILAAPEALARTVVLVNDFGAVGIDGSLLRERGADVVELPNGCICCSLKNDLAAQIVAMAAEYRPERMVIEPSGVADLAALVAVLGQPSLRSLVKRLHVRTLIDAASFPADYARLAAHFEAQVRLADVLVLNKTDLVSAAGYGLVQSSLRAVNARAGLLATRYGIEVEAPSAPASRFVAELVAPETHLCDATCDHGFGAGDGDAHREALGFANWSVALPEAAIDPDRLHAALSRIAAGSCGRVARLKGLARSGAGWIRFDIAGGRVSLAAFAPVGAETPRAMAIGTDLDEAGLTGALLGCARPLAAAA